MQRTPEDVVKSPLIGCVTGHVHVSWAVTPGRGWATAGTVGVAIARASHSQTQRDPHEVASPPLSGQLGLEHGLPRRPAARVVVHAVVVDGPPTPR